MRAHGVTLEVHLETVESGASDAERFPGLAPGPYVSLRISDTGVGIDPELMDRIFEPYFSTKPVGEGTGMGLAVVHGIVKGHDGGIAVDSKRGEGSTFEIRLPLTVQAAGGQVDEPAVVPGGSERILYVEDEELMINAIRPILQRFGYRVDARKSSREALAAFRERPDAYDLVITDQSMPEMTGDQLAKALLAVRPDLPIVLITGYSEVIDEKRAKALGIRAFVMKPVAMRELAETIRRVLGPGLAS